MLLYKISLTNISRTACNYIESELEIFISWDTVIIYHFFFQFGICKSANLDQRENDETHLSGVTISINLSMCRSENIQKFQKTHITQFMGHSDHLFGLTQTGSGQLGSGRFGSRLKKTYPNPTLFRTRLTRVGSIRVWVSSGLCRLKIIQFWCLHTN